MSSATTQLDRQFCVHCSNRMMNMTSLDTCVGDLLPSAVGQPGTETELVVALELRITPADEVTEGLLAVRSGTEAPLPAYRGDEPTYVLSLLGYDGDVLVEESFTVSFFYSGPVVEGVDYSGDGVDEFDLSVRLPFLNGMSHVQIRHGDQVIHTEDLPVATVHGTVTTAGIPIADAQVTLHGPGNERAMARTSTASEFVLAVTVPGQYTLSVDPLDPNMFPGERLVVLTLGDSYREDFDLQTAGSIDGSVLDALGAPVTEAWIYPDVFEPPYYKVQETASISCQRWILVRTPSPSTLQGTGIGTST